MCARAINLPIWLTLPFGDSTETNILHFGWSTEIIKITCTSSTSSVIVIIVMSICIPTCIISSSCKYCTRMHRAISVDPDVWNITHVTALVTIVAESFVETFRALIAQGPGMFFLDGCIETLQYILQIDGTFRIRCTASRHPGTPVTHAHCSTVLVYNTQITHDTRTHTHTLVLCGEGLL